MRVDLFVLSACLLLTGFAFFLFGIYHFVAMTRQMRPESRVASNLLGFLIFLFPSSFTERGNYHRKKFFLGVGVGGVFLLGFLFLQKTGSM